MDVILEGEDMPVLRSRSNGDLLWGYFYRLHILTLVEARDWELISTATWVHSDVPAPDWVMWGEPQSVKDREIHGCSINPDHITRREIVTLDLVLHGGPVLLPFVPTFGYTVCNSSVAQYIEKSGLKGVEFIPVNIVLNESDFADAKLFGLRLCGRDPRRLPIVEPAEMNKCANCGFGPVLCSECGDILVRCSKCGQKCVIAKEEQKRPRDGRIVNTIGEVSPCIIDGERWDGSDFCDGAMHGIVTGRALDSLLTAHVGPFRAEPLAIDVSQIDSARRARLTRSKTWIG